MTGPSGKLCVLQADSRPFEFHCRSRALDYLESDDTHEMMRSLNGGELGRTWEHWACSAIINRLKSSIMGWDHHLVTIEPRHHTGRHVTWGKIRVLLEFMEKHSGIGVVALLDTDAFIRDEEKFGALAAHLAATAGKHGVLSREPVMEKNTYINTGCMILKNSEFSRRFLRDVWEDAEGRPEHWTEWPHEQMAASRLVKARKAAFYVLRPAVLNTPCGEIVRHGWWKDLFHEVAEDELKSTVSSMLFKERCAPRQGATLDISSLLDT